MNQAVAKFLKNKNVDPRFKEEVRRIIEEMLEQFKYRFAHETLRSMLAQLDEHGYLTDAQLLAVDNIKNSVFNQKGRRRR